MFLDFIEIGTSDFDTLIQKARPDEAGLSIDAVAHYLDRLPCPPACRKLNAAISNYDGEVSVFYVSPEEISRQGLPEWVRGCNSIGHVHPTILRYFSQKNLPASLVQESRVPVWRLHSVFQRLGVSGVYLLKVDTEGHDPIILMDFFERAPVHCYPHLLYFESSILADNDLVHRLIAKLLLAGYDIVRCETGGLASDTCLRLNIRRVPGRTRFTAPIPGYFLSGYPTGYDPTNPPHANTLEDAQRHCVKTGQGGVTFQYGRYEVRNGRYLDAHKSEPQLQSWALLP